MEYLHSEPNMSEIVYVFGAGVNSDIDLSGFSPPLITNFFNVALGIKKFSNDIYDIILEDLYKYIEQKWGKNKTDLKDDPFNIEDIFTKIEEDFLSACNENDHKTAKRLYLIKFRLQSFFCEVLQEFDACIYKSRNMLLLGKLIHEEKANVITLNYDCFIEYFIELASEYNLSTNAPKLAFNRYNWSRLLGYSTNNFDIIELPKSGIGKVLITGDKLYDNTNLHLFSVLKLHGSLNWFKYLPLRKYPELDDDEIKLPNDKQDKLHLVNGSWYLNEPPSLDGWYLDPVIITPTSFKNDYLELNKSILNPIWNKAKQALSNCKKLVIIGYSFSDEPIKELFSDVFTKHPLEELIVVNPDPLIAKNVKEICYFKGVITKYNNLTEYLQNIDLDRIQILEGLIELGKTLIESLEIKGIKPNGALWVRVAKNDELKLFLIHDTEKTRNVFDTLRFVLSEMDGISKNQIVIIEPDNGLVQRLKRVSNNLSNRTNIGVVEFIEYGNIKRVDVKYIYYLNGQKDKMPPIPINDIEFPSKL